MRSSMQPYPAHSPQPTSTNTMNVLRLILLVLVLYTGNVLLTLMRSMNEAQHITFTKTGLRNYERPFSHFCLISVLLPAIRDPKQKNAV